jgi:hypothetical protein
VARNRRHLVVRLVHEHRVTAPFAKEQAAMLGQVAQKVAARRFTRRLSSAARG